MRYASIPKARAGSACRPTLPSAPPSLTTFNQDHRRHGNTIADATPPAWNGYRAHRHRLMRRGVRALDHAPGLPLTRAGPLARHYRATLGGTWYRYSFRYSISAPRSSMATRMRSRIDSMDRRRSPLTTGRWRMLA